MWKQPLYERIPLLWVLVGLLFNATGLYLGFEYSLSFLYMMVGWFCLAFGVALIGLRYRERPKSSADRRLSPQFVSAGATQMMPSISSEDQAPAAEAADTSEAQ